MDVEELKNRARSLERDGQLAEALAAYRQVLRYLEEHGDTAAALPLYVKSGDLAIKTGDRKGGLGLYGRAAKRYAEAGSADSVVALCTKIVRMSPANTYVYPRLARLMIARGHVDAARRVLVDYAAKTKQAKGRDALERLAGRPDTQVKGILEKLLDAAEKRERAVAERAKRAAAQAPSPAPPPQQPAPVEPDVRSPAPPEAPPAERDTGPRIDPPAPEPAAEDARSGGRDSPPAPEPKEEVERIGVDEIPAAADATPAADAGPPTEEPRPAGDEAEPPVAEPEFEAPAIELDAEPRFEPPRLTPVAEPEPAEPEHARTEPTDDASDEEDHASPDWSPWPAPEPEPAHEVSAGGRMTDEPLIFAASETPKRSGKVWMVLGAVVVLAGAGGLFATGILGGGSGGEAAPEPAAPQRPTVTPPRSDSAGMPLAMADSLSRDTAAADSLADSLGIDSTALALLDDTLAPGDTAVPADTTPLAAGDSATGGGDDDAAGPDSSVVAPAADTAAAPPSPVTPPAPAADRTPEAALAAIGRPAVIVAGLPILSVREVVSNGRPGVQVGQTHPSGEPLSVVTVPLGTDTAAMGVITLPGDTAIGTTRMGNFLVSVRGRVPADTLAALLRRLTVARSN